MRELVFLWYNFWVIFLKERILLRTQEKNELHTRLLLPQGFLLFHKKIACFPPTHPTWKEVPLSFYAVCATLSRHLLVSQLLFTTTCKRVQFKALYLSFVMQRTGEKQNPDLFSVRPWTISIQNYYLEDVFKAIFTEFVLV